MNSLMILLVNKSLTQSYYNKNQEDQLMLLLEY